MPQIYTGARKVLVHLGLQADGSELLPSLLEYLEKVDLACIQERKMSSEDFFSYGLPPLEDEVWKVFGALLCRSWFLRVWIIQEVVLAHDIRFFCGEWELRRGLIAVLAEKFDYVLTNNTHIRHPYWTQDFQKAQHAAMSLALVLAFRLTRPAVSARLEFLRGDIEYIPSTKSRETHIKNLAQDLVAKLELIVKSRREYRELYPCLERMILAFDGVKASSTPILKLLGIFLHNEATKPQDRLYALIGLAADINLEEFSPDYEETEYQTNARFGRKFGRERPRHGPPLP